MGDQKNLPIKATARNVVVPAEKHGSLVARGLAAVRISKKMAQNALNELPPGGFDAEIYRQAKPHFETALKAFQDAGKTIKDLFKLLIEQFGLGVKPYAIQFSKDMRLSANLKQNAMPKQAESKRAVSEASRTAELVRERLSQKYCDLGRSCYAGRNYEQAMAWYRTAAERGHFLSQLFLAEMYEDGRGIQDDKQAVFWFHKALETCPLSGDTQKGLGRLGVEWKKK